MKNEGSAEQTQEKSGVPDAEEKSAPDAAATPENSDAKNAPAFEKSDAPAGDAPAGDVPASEKTDDEAEKTGDEPCCCCCARRRRRRRILIAVAACIVVLGAAFLVVIGNFLGPIVKAGANAVGASILGVDKFSIGTAEIYPFSGYARFENIFIGKPVEEGLDFSRDMLSLEFVEVDVDLSTLLSQKKVLERFELRNMNANYEELLGGESNVEVVVDHVLGKGSFDELLNGEEEETDDEPKSDEAEETDEMYVAANYLVIENANAGASVRGVPAMFPSFSASYPDGVGLDENLTPDDFAVKVAGDYLNVFSSLGDATGAAVGAVGDAAGATTDAVGDAAGATVDAVSGAAGTVFGIFSGDDEESAAEAPAENTQQAAPSDAGQQNPPADN